jgi:plastocyanin
MATIEYWIQLENRPLDSSPNNIDRVMGRTIKEMTGPGNFTYHCDAHGCSMAGTVTVMQ